MTLTPRFTLFPKFYRHLGLEALAALVREVGLDTTQVVIREGYAVTEAGLRRELPAACERLRRAGLAVDSCTSDFRIEALLADPEPLAIMAGCGIRRFRLAHLRTQGEHPRAVQRRFRAQLERLQPLLERHGLSCLSQLHHGTAMASASAALLVFEGLPPVSFAIEIDPGNEQFEGFEDWPYAVPLLGGLIGAVGIKDTLIDHGGDRSAPGKGWRRECCAIDEGLTDWPALLTELERVAFAGDFEFMPFYHPDQPQLLTAVLRREVAWLRGQLAAISAVAASGRSAASAP